MLAPRDRIAGVLLRAADDIDRHGWCQGTSEIGDARCAAWAITKAADYDFKVSEEAGRRLMRSLGIGEPFVRAVPHWNDKNGRTKEEVVEALRSAAFAAA